MFEVPSSWKPAPVSSLPSWEGANQVAIDCETFDPDLKKLGPGVRRGGFIAGVSVAIQDGPAFYLPLRHAVGPNQPEALNYLRDQARVFTGMIVNANLSYDLDYLAEAGITFPQVKWFRDVLIADPLINQHEWTYSLDSVAKRWLGDSVGKNETMLKQQAELSGLHEKAELWKMHPKHVAPYAIEDARLALAIYAKQCDQIQLEGLWSVFDLESRLLPVLLKMRRRGVRVDLNRLELIENWCQDQEKLALDQVFGLTGVNVEVNDTKTVAAAMLSTGAAIPELLTPKGKQSWDASTLRGIVHPAARALERAKKMNKIRCTFAASVRRFAVKGRIHCSLNQIRYEKDDGDLGGVGFGRLSSALPNLQQQPGRDPELGPFWRSVYVPEDGERWASCDFSGQEPRWIVHYASLIEATGSAEMVAAYHENPDFDLHQKTADLAKIKRKDAKTIFLGLAYGMGGAHLCENLGLPLADSVETARRRAQAKEEQWNDGDCDYSMLRFAGPEGQAVIDQFNKMVPFLKGIQGTTRACAKNRGWVKTVLGRKCKFEKRNNKWTYTHKALNRIVQGSSADQTKKAMIDADAAGIPLVLQVHDEIDFSTGSEAQAHELARIMRDAVPMRVPAKVDIELGQSWGDSMAEAKKSRELMKMEW